MKNKHSLRGKMVVILLMCALFSLTYRAKAEEIWTEDPSNPVFGPTHRAYYPSVIKIEGTYYMYYYGSGGLIYYTTSSDGITWTPESSTDVAGNHPWVIEDDTGYNMYYWDTSIPKWIGYATSPDGVAWTNLGAVNIASLPGSSGLYDWVVIYNGPGDYEAWGDDNFGLIVHSTSSDGVNWAAGQRVTIDGIPPSYTRPHVIRDNDGNYHMWIGYQDESCPHVDSTWNSMIGYATGTTPTSFTASGSNPIFSRCDDPIGWRPKRTYTPMVIKDGSSYKMWFTGKSSEGKYAIGYATGVPPECVPPPSGLVSWWPGDENADDIVGGNNGELVGGAAFVSPGKVDDAFTFTGSGTDYVRVPNDSSLELTNVTVDAWVRAYGSPGNNLYIVAKGANACSTASYALYTRGGGLCFYVGNGSSYVPSPIAAGGVIWDGNWHHIAGTYNGSFVRLYVDGAEVGNGTSTTFTIVYGLGSDNDLIFGRYTGTCSLPFIGDVDEVEIYDHALSQQQIQDIFNAGSAGKCKYIEVDIDIKPGGDQNTINLSSAGVISVAILGSDTFDATAVDPGTVRLAGAAVKMTGKSGKYLSQERDVNNDGFLDLVCQVITTQFMLETGAEIATLIAETFEGKSIRGMDIIRIVPDK